MIFLIIAAITLLVTIYILSLPWDKLLPKWVFAVNMAAICAILIMFGLDCRLNVKKAVASRRTTVTAIDVSASAGIKMNDFARIADNAFIDYSLDVIPFSNQVCGLEGAESTGLVKSLKKILSYISTQYEDDEIANLVLISDGNETENISQIKEGLSLSGNYPHNVLYLKSQNHSVNFDKSVSFLKAPRFMPRYTRESVSFSVNVIGAGLSGVPVELMLNGKHLGATFVHLHDGYGEGEFELMVQRAGMDLLEASVAIDYRETITDNNRDYAVVEGVHKGFRVLHISGHPSCDTAFVRRGLQNIPGVDLISFFILRKRNQASNAHESELSLIPFPTDQLFRSELDNFDLIIINDFKLTEFLSSYYINNIVKFVNSSGGLLVMGGPESFTLEDSISNRFASILPFSPVKSNNWSNEKLKIVPEKISELTSLSGLKKIKNLNIKGLNRVSPKDWGNVFFRSAKGQPLIVGGIKGKARVLAVLTDSFWRFSYGAGLSNEAALKSLARYVLGISSMPVTINNNILSFDKNFSLMKMSDVSAQIQFLNYDGSVQKVETIGLKSNYSIGKLDAILINVTIKHKETIIDKYQLLNHEEKRWDEHSYLPKGKEFLQQFAGEGNGDFIAVNMNEIKSTLKDLSIRKPVVVLDKIAVKNPVYMNKAVLLLFLYLVLFSFYLKSRFVG